MAQVPFSTYATEACPLPDIWYLDIKSVFICPCFLSSGDSWLLFSQYTNIDLGSTIWRLNFPFLSVITRLSVLSLFSFHF